MNVTVFVRDEGAGIRKDQIVKIFERFYRIDDKLTRRAHGTGLGPISGQSDRRSPWR